jgi:pimeloyl-ACP methyl ester carboxylesterase
MEKRIRLLTHSVNVQFIGSHHGQAGPVLVFLHEALGSVIQWKQFPSALCRAAELPGIVIERQGHGKSDPLTQPRTESYLHDYTCELHEVLSELLPLNTPVILVGHSDGGTIALLYAALFPKNVNAIVTMAAHVLVESETLAGIAPAVAAWQEGKLDGLKRIHGDKAETLFYAWADTWRADFFRSWNITGEIASISCPALVMQGTADQYGTEAQVTAIAEAVPHAETVFIKDCGHHPHLEKPAEVLEAIETFLSAKLR